MTRRANSAIPRPGGLAIAMLGAVLAVGCQTQTEVQLRRDVARLREVVKEKDSELAARKASIDELHRQLEVARGISDEDLKRIFYPEKLVIDKLSGGADYNGQPGDDGVTVYLRPVDREGDVIKVVGDISIQLYDLAATPQQNFIGEYKIPVDQAGRLWHGKFLTNHYTIKCPWPHGPPKHTEITIRATFVDYLTKRVISAQTTCTVKLPPD